MNSFSEIILKMLLRRGKPCHISGGASIQSHCEMVEDRVFPGS